MDVKAAPASGGNPNQIREYERLSGRVFDVRFSPDGTRAFAGASLDGKGQGEPVRILDLAEDLIRLSGLEPHRDIEIAYTGIRPGEKLTEELWDEGTPLKPTLHPDISRLDNEASSLGLDLPQAIESLSHLSHSDDTEAIAKLLDELIPGSSIRETPQPDITSFI